MEQIPLTTHAEMVNGIPVLNPVGEIDLSTTSIFKKAISDLISLGHIHVIIDMSNVAYMDSSGFGILLSAIQVLRPRNGALVLACCNETITRMLTITRLNMVFPVYATRPEAISDIEHREAVHEPA